MVSVHSSRSFDGYRLLQREGFTGKDFRSLSLSDVNTKQLNWTFLVDSELSVYEEKQPPYPHSTIKPTAPTTQPLTASIQPTTDQDLQPLTDNSQQPLLDKTETGFNRKFLLQSNTEEFRRQVTEDFEGPINEEGRQVTTENIQPATDIIQPVINSRPVYVNCAIPAALLRPYELEMLESGIPLTERELASSEADEMMCTGDRQTIMPDIHVRESEEVIYVQPRSLESTWQLVRRRVSRSLSRAASWLSGCARVRPHYIDDTYPISHHHGNHGNSRGNIGGNFPPPFGGDMTLGSLPTGSGRRRQYYFDDDDSDSELIHE